MSQCQSNNRIKSKKKTHNKILLRSGFTVTFRTTKEIEVINGKYCPRIMVSRHGFLTKYYVVQVYTLQIEKKQKNGLKVMFIHKIKIVNNDQLFFDDFQVLSVLQMLYRTFDTHVVSLSDGQFLHDL